MQMEVYNPSQQQFFNEEQVGRLKSPLQTTRIKERKGFGGKMLKYLKADYVIGVANEIFGYGRWGYKVVARDHTVVEDPKKGGPVHMYTADIELSVFGCPFTFPGDGVGIVNDPYTVEMHEKARKEATSDAIKRALRHYGDQFGLCLYDEDDMVETPDGTKVPVKDAKPQKAPQPKRVVDATNTPPAQKPVAKDPKRDRLNQCYVDAKSLKLFKIGQSDQENVTAFFAYITEVAGHTVSSPAEMTEEIFKAVEQDIAIEGEKSLGVPA